MKGLFLTCLCASVFYANICGMQKPDSSCSRLTLRLLTVGDYYRGYLQLLEQLTVVGADQVTLDQFASFVGLLSPQHMVAVIEDGAIARIVAAATLFIEHKCIHGMGSVGHIEDVVVDGALRGAGLGRRVVNFLVEHARDHGCYKVILDCSAENAPFYEKCGFVSKGFEMAKYF